MLFSCCSAQSLIHALQHKPQTAVRWQPLHGDTKNITPWHITESLSIDCTLFSTKNKQTNKKNAVTAYTCPVLLEKLWQYLYKVLLQWVGVQECSMQGNEVQQKVSYTNFSYQNGSVIWMDTPGAGGVQVTGSSQYFSPRNSYTPDINTENGTIWQQCKKEEEEERTYKLVIYQIKCPWYKKK